jgi:hypothetical protein
MPRRPCINARVCGGEARPGGSYCQSCSSARERDRTAKRADSEPWRMLYETADWKMARRSALARDDYRCVVEENGERCRVSDLSGRRLHVHHTKPLRKLWLLALGDVRRFVRLACRLDDLVTVCPAHNNALDAALRAGERRPAR